MVSEESSPAPRYIAINRNRRKGKLVDYQVVHKEGYIGEFRKIEVRLGDPEGKELSGPGEGE